ncbi:MAG TPA: hypothetical protein VGS79_09715 [Puia sp.]|nr:hypothetical protein [Puia sp.]
MTSIRLNRLLLLFVPVFGLAVSSMAQMTRSRALDSLIKLQLVTPREKGYMEKAMAGPDQDYSRRDELLGLLVRAKMYSTSGTYSGISFLAEPASSRSLPATVIRAGLDSFIRAMDKAGLLSGYTRAELLRYNEKDRFGWKIQVAELAYEGANQEYFLRPEKFDRFLDSIHAVGAISDNNYRALLQKSASGELHRYSELPAYLNFCVTIHLDELPRDSVAFLHALYAATSRVMPGLDYDTIAFRLEKDKEDSEPDFQAWNLVATINRKGELFSYSGFYNAEYKNKSAHEWPMPDGFHSVFNKVLADLGSPYRLHTFAIDTNTVGVIGLTESAFKQFSWTYDGALVSYLRVNYENYAGGFTRRSIQAAIRTYDSLELFKNLSTTEKDSCINVVNNSEIRHYSDILKCFKDQVLDIDVKYGIDSGHYARITGWAAQISKGRFRPAKIVDGYSYEHPQFTYGFTVGNKVYSVGLHQDGKYLDPEFWTLIDSAMKENDPEGAFHYIYPSDGITEIYLTNAQFAFLQQHRLLEFTEPEE